MHKASQETSKVTCYNPETGAKQQFSKFNNYNDDLQNKRTLAENCKFLQNFENVLTQNVAPSNSLSASKRICLQLLARLFYKCCLVNTNTIKLHKH